MKKAQVLSFIFAIGISLHASSQSQFQKTYGTPLTYEGSYQLCLTSDGGFVVVGNTSIGGTNISDIYLIKADSMGVMQWNKIFTRPGSDNGYSISETPDNGFVIAGSSEDTATGYKDALLLKTDALGNLLWVKLYGGPYTDEAYSVQVTYDGGYILAGITRNFSTQTNDHSYLVKTDSAGNVLWDHSYNQGIKSTASSVIQTTDSGYLSAGYNYSSGVAWEGQLIKTDKSGVFQWSKTYGGIENQYLIDLKQTSDGGLVLIGRLDTVSTTNQSICLIRMDIQGNVLWAKSYDGYLEDWPYSIDQTSDGGFLIGGQTRSFGVNGFSNMYLLKTDDMGSVSWVKIYGVNQFSGGHCARQTNDQGFLCCGVLDVQTSHSELFVVKTDSLGNATCNDSVVTFNESNITLITGGSFPVGFSGGTVTAASCNVTDDAIENDVCGPTGTSESFPTSFQLSPNPVSSHLNIGFRESVNEITVQIFSMLGVIVHSENNLSGNEFRLTLPHLESGIYVVRVSNSRNYFSRKIVVTQD